MRRQDLARHPEFEPNQLFAYLDKNNNGSINCNELYDFMNRQYLSPRAADVDDIIREFDSTQDGRLNFEELC